MDWVDLTKKVLLCIHRVEFDTHPRIQCKKKWWQHFEDRPALWAPTHKRFARRLPTSKKDLETARARFQLAKTKYDTLQIPELQAELQAARSSVTELRDANFLTV